MHTTARAAAVAVGLGVLAFGPPSSAVIALNNSISGPASLTSGLQGAVRLNPPPPDTGPTLSAEVQAVLASVNAERAARGISPVTYHAQLTQAAVAHAADQARFDCITTLSHTGTDGSNPGVRIARTGLSVSTWAENIACGQRTPDQVMQAWMNSAGHRANILNPSLTHIGISVSTDALGRLYWVQVFGTPR